MKHSVWIAFLIVSTWSTQLKAQNTKLGDSVIGCAWMEPMRKALGAEDAETYFSGWEAKDYKWAMENVRVCTQEGKKNGLFTVHSKVAEYMLPLLQTRMDNQGKAEARAADDQKAAHVKFIQCRFSTQYKLYTVQERILLDYSTIAAAQSDISRQRRIEDVSGVVDLAAKNRDGRAVVDSQDDIAKAWPEYKANGGQAGSPDAVTRTISDPCR